MVKLMICLVAGIGVAIAVLQVRQQHLEINYQINKLHNQIDSQQAKLWNQQLQIAIYAGNGSIAQTIEAHTLNLVPATPKEQDGQGIDRPMYTAAAN